MQNQSRCITQALRGERSITDVLSARNAFGSSVGPDPCSANVNETLFPVDISSRRQHSDRSVVVLSPYSCEGKKGKESETNQEKKGWPGRLQNTIRLPCPVVLSCAETLQCQSCDHADDHQSASYFPSVFAIRYIHSRVGNKGTHGTPVVLTQYMRVARSSILSVFARPSFNN